MQLKIGLVVGSLRKGAYSRLLAQAVQSLSPPSLTFVDVGIGDLPLYNPDLDAENVPASWSSFRSEVIGAHAVLFITPEHNRGMPGALKNAIDVGSRPWGKSVWSGKPTAVITQATGALGGTAANQQVRLAMSMMDSPVLPGNEMYIPRIGTLFDESGKLNNPDTARLITSFLAALESWIKRFR